MSKGAYCLIYHFAKKFRQSKGNSTLLSYNQTFTIFLFISEIVAKYHSGKRAKRHYRRQAWSSRYSRPLDQFVGLHFPFFFFVSYISSSRKERSIKYNFKWWFS